MSITGAEGGGGFKTGIAIADLTTAMFATQGILLAIIAREKTGKGQYVDTAIQDGQAALMSHAAGNYFATGAPPGRLGNRHPSISPYRDFPCSDGELIVAAANDSLWQKFARAIGRADLADDPGWEKNAARVSGRDELEAEIEQTMRTKPARSGPKSYREPACPAGRCGRLRSCARTRKSITARWSSRWSTRGPAS